jgi:hypothetical protein
MQVEIEVGDLVERATDARGRITLGSEYADKTVTVAVMEVQDNE